MILTFLYTYTSTLETQLFSIDNNDEFITFVSLFKYLELITDFLLDNSTDIKNRIFNHKSYRRINIQLGYR